MRWHHYLGAPCKIGESVYYACVLEERWVVLSSFNASALKSRARGWPVRHGHPLLLPETFIDPARFEGTCQGGSTPGTMWVRPLRSNARQRLARARLPACFPHRQEAAEAYPEDIQLSIPGHFPHLTDPRGRQGRRYRPETLPALSAAAVFAGARGCPETGEWIREQSDAVLRHFRPGLRRGRVQRPGVTCIRNALINVDPGEFDRVRHAWKGSTGTPDTAIAIDGRTLRGAVDGEGRPVHLPVAVGHRSRTTLAKKTSGSTRPAATGRSTPAGQACAFPCRRKCRNPKAGSLPGMPCLPPAGLPGTSLTGAPTACST